MARRRALVLCLLAPALAFCRRGLLLGLLVPLPARAELSPPMERAVKRYAEPLQNAMDFLHFDIQRPVTI